MIGLSALMLAGTLGLLAFFEPCTIATHGLFAEYAHRSPRRACCQGLLTVWLARSLLLLVLFATPVLLFAPMRLSVTTQGVGLLALGSLYLISRRIVLPVPHIEFARLIPGGRRLGRAVTLGLTIPACVIPLLLVVGVAVQQTGSLAVAAWAAILFAGLFNLPMALAARRGLTPAARDLFSRSARAAPYVTATLLFALALALWLPQLDLGRHGLDQAFSQADLAGLVVGFFAGLVFSFNPVAFAAIPMALAYVTRAHEPVRAHRLALAFIAGMIVTHVALGVAAGLGGHWAQGLLGRQWGLVLGPLLILLGLVWAGWLRISLPWFRLRARPVTGTAGAFLLGFPFSVAVCPFCAPALLVALTASASLQSPGYGAALLFSFALGRSLPILLGAWAMSWLESLKVMMRYQRLFEVLGGVVLILTGLYLLNEYTFWIDYTRWL